MSYVKFLDTLVVVFLIYVSTSINQDTSTKKARIFHGLPYLWRMLKYIYSFICKSNLNLCAHCYIFHLYSYSSYSDGL